MHIIVENKQINYSVLYKKCIEKGKKKDIIKVMISYLFKKIVLNEGNTSITGRKGEEA